MNHPSTIYTSLFNIPINSFKKFKTTKDTITKKDDFSSKKVKRTRLISIRSRSIASKYLNMYIRKRNILSKIKSSRISRYFKVIFRS